MRPNALNTLFDTYNNLDSGSLNLLDSIYDESIVFEDPIRRIEGLSNLKQYFDRLYKNVVNTTFSSCLTIEEGDHAAISWTGRIQHQTFNQSRPITIHGVSVLHYEDKIKYHRDYFDLGQMIYENITFLGGIIAIIKRKL